MSQTILITIAVCALLFLLFLPPKDQAVVHLKKLNRYLTPKRVIRGISGLALTYALWQTYSLSQIDPALLLTTPAAMIVFCVGGCAFAWYLTSIKHPKAWLSALLCVLSAALV